MLKVFDGLAVDPNTVVAVSAFMEHPTMLVECPDDSVALIDISQEAAHDLIKHLAERSE